jgi:two-component system, cell cycle response regulator
MNSKGRILVVDDEPRNVKLLAAYLKADGYESVCAYNGAQALQLAKSGAPDVILLDVMMPDMDGYEVTRALKLDKITSQTPIVLVTSLDGSQNRTKGLNVGADEFLTKPVNRSELIARVRALHRMKKLNEELQNRQNIVASISAAESSSVEASNLILVIEDDVKLCRKIKKVLELSDLRCLVSTNSAEARHLLNTESPDLILLDRILPDGDGINFMMDIKRIHKLRDVPVIIITALSELAPKISGIESGADDYLIKPIEHSELLARIRAGLRRYNATKKLRLALQQAQSGTVTDKLTGVRNRYYLDADLSYRVAQANRQKNRGFSILMIDIDHFKVINDSHGHLAGDRVLCKVAAQLLQDARAADIVTRFGGEEFCIILPETDITEAIKIANRMREGIEQTTIDGIDKITLTVSIGVTEYTTGDKEAIQLLARADMALYTSKDAGRNTVSVAQ